MASTQTMTMMAPVVLMLIALLPQSLSITINDCPEGLHRDKYLQVRGNFCYVFMTYKSNDFDHAQRDCHAHKGNLATVRDKDTQDYLYTMLRNTYHEDEPVWIGLSDDDDEGEWEWRDGSKARYTNWDDNQPGIGSSLEDCAAINMEEGGKWHDYRCNDLFIIHFDHPYVCEYGPVGITTGTPTTTRATMTTTATTTKRPMNSTVTDTTATTQTTTTPAPTTVTFTTPTTATTTPTTTATTTPKPTTTTATTTTATTASTTTATTTTTTVPTTATATTSTKAVTTQTPVATTTTTSQPQSTTCPPFVCPDLSCGLDGYKQGPDGCTLCQCDT